MLPVEAVLKQLAVGVEIVYYDIGIAAMARSEENQLEAAGEVVQQGNYIRPDVDACLKHFSRLHLDG